MDENCITFVDDEHNDDHDHDNNTDDDYDAISDMYGGQENGKLL